jgi:GT2 family glycosyltransferase
MDSEVAVIICSYGREDLTCQVIADLECSKTSYRVCVVDNRGSFVDEPGSGIQVLRPGTNLGWARGSNLGLRHMISETNAASYVLLNNDVRLSRGFVHGLHSASQRTAGGVIAPVYDHNWPQQRVTYAGSPSAYRSKTVDRRVPFVDGTCMFIGRCTIEEVGFLDEVSWPDWGWGCDKDYCLRVRAAGLGIVVTEGSFLSHLGRGTAATIPGFSEAQAEAENDAGMATKWGESWRELLYSGFEGCDRIGLVQSRLQGP